MCIRLIGLATIFAVASTSQAAPMFLFIQDGPTDFRVAIEDATDLDFFDAEVHITSDNPLAVAGVDFGFSSLIRPGDPDYVFDSDGA